MIQRRKVLVLYANSICNLKCRYCFIEKSEKLKKIDTLLEECYKTDYFVNFCKEIFPDPDQLEEIQVWGGEPTLSLDRVTPTIQKLLQFYPNVRKIMLSTNLTTESCVVSLLNFIASMNSVLNHPIIFNIQISVDGPKSVTDFNRGEGVTDKILLNFSKLLVGYQQFNKDHPDNLVQIVSHTKSTLDISSIESLQTEKSITDYYLFLEAFVNAYNKIKPINMDFTTPPPNCARPLPVTKDVGLKFANFCELCRCLEKKNIFKYFKEITPFSTKQHGLDYKNCWNCGICGSGYFVFGLLPNDMISVCHDGFITLCSEQKKSNVDSSLVRGFFDNDSKTPLVFHKSKLEQREKFVSSFYNNKETNMVFALTGSIILLAQNNLIDSKYLSFTKAKEGANFILSHSCYCIRDNLNVTGSQLLTSTDEIILFLNGAKEYIEDMCREENLDESR